MSQPKAIESPEDFKAELEKAGDKVIIVDFHATWCGPCKMIAPFLAELAGKHTERIVLKVDVDELEDLAAKYGVEAMPTFVVIKNGEKITELKGASKEKLQALFEATY